jgi:hypothetical protein
MGVPDGRGKQIEGHREDEMNRNRRRVARNFGHALVAAVIAATVGLAVGLTAEPAAAQVSPSEIRNPKLSAMEGQYLSQLQSMQAAIGQTQFRMPFILTRYVGVDPAKQAALDTRGVEFVYFHDRTLLKTSGFYTAAYNAEELTPNERAGRTFEEVVAPILRLMTQQIPEYVACDGIGFEIAYHTRAAHRNSDFEGREILAVVLNRADAFALASEAGSEGRQAILNRSQIYLDAKPIGLALGKKDALDLETLGRMGGTEPEASGSSASARDPVSGFSLLSPRRAMSGASSYAKTATKADTGAGAVAVSEAKPMVAKTATAEEAEKFQAQYQEELDAVMKQAAQFHLVEYAMPSFAVYHKQLVLQFTLQNPLAFDKSGSSIYKRAAQSFDLFVAPELKALVAMLPADRQIEALDFSVMNRMGNEKDSSEPVEFVCPLKGIQAFVNDEMTSQDLIDQSVVLVNGVRINLNLELVE